MPPVRNLPPGYTVIFPNREKASSKVTKVIVALILVISAALILAVTIGGWSKLQGLKPVALIWCVVYLIIAVFVMRWSRGLLPIAAGLAILMLLDSLIAGTGVASTSWFSRSHAGFAAAQSLFGGTGFSANTLGLLTLLIAPVQLLLIFFAMQGFAQGWNVEVEAPIDPSKRRSRGPSAPPAPAAA